MSLDTSWSMTLRGRTCIYTTVIKINHSIKWTIPCFPVLTLTFLTGKSIIEDVETDVLFQADEHSLLMADLPRDIIVTNHCQISIDNVNYYVLWDWDFIYSGLDVSSEISSYSSSTESSLDTSSVKISSSEDTGDDVFVPKEDDSTIQSVHELPFKVLGVTYSDKRQEVLQYLRDNMRKIIPLIRMQLL